MAMIISIFIGRTAAGTFTNNPAIAIANTARTNQVSIITNKRNMVLTRGFMTDPVISAMDLPFSLTETTNAPKSWTAPMKIVPKTTHKKAGSHPQNAAIQGPIMGAAPAMDV